MGLNDTKGNSIVLRPYQAELYDGIVAKQTEGHKHVMGVLPTGGGKTRLISAFVRGCDGISCAIAHRQELTYQIAMALAEAGIYHRILAPDPLIRFISRTQAVELGHSYVNGEACAAVASVDTLNARSAQLEKWVARVSLVQGDEGHHWLSTNKWGKAFHTFTTARGILWTATPRRADRKSLAADDGGICTAMVVGPSMRDLMRQGYLSRYVVYGPPVSYSRDTLRTGGTGDFSMPSVQQASRSSQIIGDIIEHYKKLAPGKRGLTFLTDVNQAFKLAEAFRGIGLPAVAMSAEHTPTDERVTNMRAFRAGDIKMVVNVDLFGEGTDVPGVEVICDGAATMSLPRFMQRLGRLLRPAPGKDAGIYIDHVSNYADFIERAGCLPEDVADWSLTVPDRRARQENDASLRVSACVRCFLLRPAYLRACPHCGYEAPRQPRDRPEQVDGDLMEYTDALLRRLTGQADKIMLPAPTGIPGYVAVNWEHRRHAQAELRLAMQQWGGVRRQEGMERSDAWRMFFARFGVDVMTAQTWGAAEAAALKDRIMKDLQG